MSTESEIRFRMNVEMVRALTNLLRGHFEGSPLEVSRKVYIPDEDDDLCGAWLDSLREELEHDFAVLSTLLNRPEFTQGRIVMDEPMACSVLRACASIRLKLREAELRDITDDQLERGDLEVEHLGPRENRAMAIYSLLAHFQEMVLFHLDPDIYEDL